MKNLGVVLSNGRSGSSIVCGVIAAHGAWTGDVKPPDERNPKGHFENSAIYNKASEMYGSMREGTETAENDDKWAVVFGRILAGQGYKEGAVIIKHTPAHYKIWEPLKPIFITVRRTLYSQIKSRDSLGWLVDHDNLRHKENIMDDLERHGMSIRIDGHALVNGDYCQIEHAITEMGMKFDPQIAKDFIDPNHWHYGA